MSQKKKENENKNSNLDDSVQSDSSIKKESVLTLSKYVFAEEPITPKNPESKLIQSAMNQSKIKRNSTKVRILHNEKINKHKAANPRQVGESDSRVTTLLDTNVQF